MQNFSFFFSRLPHWRYALKYFLVGCAQKASMCEPAVQQDGVWKRKIAKRRDTTHRQLLTLKTLVISISGKNDILRYASLCYVYVVQSEIKYCFQESMRKCKTQKYEAWSLSLVGKVQRHNYTNCTALGCFSKGITYNGTFASGDNAGQENLKDLNIASIKNNTRLPEKSYWWDWIPCRSFTFNFTLATHWFFEMCAFGKA